MMQFNILKWCDEKMSYLKEQGIKIKNGIPQLPENYLYTDMPSAISTYSYRNDIPKPIRKNSLITFFMFEDHLWPRLYKIDSELKVLQEYGGICGFDLSPSIEMLRPRQLLSILVNAIYACYFGTKGIKILPNYRAGDFGTLCAADFFPDNCSFIIGNLGCERHGYGKYGEYQLEILLRKKSPDIIYVYGSIRKKEIESLILKNCFEIITFPDRRNRVRNNRKSYRYYLRENKICKDIYADLTKGGAA